MPRFELSLSPSYVPTWGVVEAIREIYQNALDKQTTDPENTMFHTLENGIIRIGSKNSMLDRSTLLLGHTTKAGDAKTIGKFGEGYKLALLVLARSGYTVKIFNYGAKELWIPEIVESTKYKARVLSINVTKYIFKAVPDHNLVFEIGLFSDEDCERIKKSNLNIAPAKNILVTKKGNVLLDEEHRRAVFVKGLFVTTLKDPKMLCGYDFAPDCITLDRDRGMVSDFNTFWATSEIWSEVEGHTDKIAAMIESDCPDVKFCKYASNAPAVQVSEHLVALFTEKHGRKAIPVHTQEEMETVKRQFPKHKPVIVNETHAAVLRSSIPLPKEPPNIRKERELTPKQHTEKLLRKIREKLSHSQIKSLEAIVQMSSEWEWKS